MSIAEKLVTIAENQQKVYNKGQLDVISKVESLKGKASGMSPLTILDVSPVEHNVGVKITTKPAFDGLLKGCTFEDTDFGYIRSSPFTVPTSGHYTVALNLEDDSKWSDWVVAWSGWRADDSPPYCGSSNPSYNEWLDLNSGYTYSLFLNTYKGLTAIDILSGTIEIGENVVAPPAGGGDVNLTDVKVTASGTNLFDVAKVKNSAYITNNGDGTVTISGIYGADTGRTLRELCPSLKVGDVAVFRITTTGNSVMYLSVSKFTWSSGSVHTITEEDLNSIVNLYGKTDKGTYTSSQIWITLGTTKLPYEPYIEPTIYTANADGIVEGVRSIYPTMVLSADANVVISAEYIKDIDKAFNELTTAVALSGGE